MSIRVDANLSIKERKLYTFENFRGVDFSTSPYKVSKNRATSAQNLIYENGTVRKRTGWKGLCKLNGRVNGIFSFEIEGENIILAYVGNKFYRLTWNASKTRLISENITTSCTYSPAAIDTSILADRRIQLYVNKNKAYIVGCGDYLVYGKWNGRFELRRVFDNVDTYIPTTTINIDKDGVADENRGILDGVNLLSSHRINTLLGVNEDSATWTLDTASIDDQSDIEIELHTLDAQGNCVEIKINNRIERDKSLLFVEGDDITEVGSINYQTGKITLSINSKPQEADTANIVVKFKSSTPGQADFIKNATLSTVFGGGGNSNRLFLSGDVLNKNKHVWSEIYDFTYFVDNNYDNIGSDNSAIMGYVRATDGVLIVFKEKNGSDASTYYVSGADVEEIDSNGDPVFMTKFTKFAGNISDTIYAKYATASLNGDNLILTRNGVRGLELYENIQTSAYRLRERGRNINSKLLKQESLEDACGFVYKDKYYLAMDNVVYVCDSRFTFQAEEDVGDSFNYEWWYFTNVDARVWCEIDNKLYFGTNNGWICKFTDQDYADVVFQDTEAGDISISYSDNKIVYNLDLESSLNQSSDIMFTNDDIYASYLTETDMQEIDSDGYIHFEEKLLEKIYEGVVCYADRTDGTGLEVSVPYYIAEVSLDELKFALYDADNNRIKPIKAGFRLSRKVSNKLLYLENIDTVNQSFQLKEFADGEILDLVIYNYSMPTELMATFQFKENVVASWYTAICDLGTNMYSKTLLNITITTEPLVKGSITAGYQTRNIEKDYITNGTHGFDFNEIDFADFSFESSFTSSHTHRVKERNFNFIVIRYVSDNQKACAVNGITIRYKINRINKGVR